MVGLNEHDEPLDGLKEDPPKATWTETIAAILAAVIVCFLFGAAAVAYLFLEILPSLNH